MATDSGREGKLSSEDISSSSASQDSWVTTVEVVLREEAAEEVDEVDVVARWREGLRTIITLRKRPFRLVDPVRALRDWKAAVRHRPCRKGSCIDASLEGETRRLTEG